MLWKSVTLDFNVFLPKCGSLFIWKTEYPSEEDEIQIRRLRAIRVSQNGSGQVDSCCRCKLWILRRYRWIIY